MKDIQAKSGLKVKATVKAGGINAGNHTCRGLKVKAGGINAGNHTRGALRIKAGVRAGGVSPQHNRALALA